MLEAICPGVSYTGILELSFDSQKVLKGKLQLPALPANPCSELGVSGEVLFLEPLMEIVLSDAFGVPTCTHIQVAEHFDKRPDNVLQSIREKIESLEALKAGSSAGVYFEGSLDVTVGKGAVRKTLCYHMTQKGFVMLAMGFTGSKALSFQVGYIDAFEATIAKLALTQEQLHDTTLLGISALGDAKIDFKRCLEEHRASAIELIALKISDPFVADPLPPPRRGDFEHAEFLYEKQHGTQAKRIYDKAESAQAKLKTLLESLPKKREVKKREVKKLEKPIPPSAYYDDGSDDIRF